jgi:hypothetical protein
VIFTAAPPAVLTRHCRHARSVIGREYPPALRTERARPPARNAVGGRTHARKGVLASTRRSLPFVECAAAVRAASPLRTPRPHTRGRTCTHTHSRARACVDVRAGIDACRGCAAEHGSRSPHAHSTVCTLRVVRGPWWSTMDEAQHYRARLLPLIPPVSMRGRVCA